MHVTTNTADGKQANLILLRGVVDTVLHYCRNVLVQGEVGEPRSVHPRQRRRRGPTSR